MQDYILNLLASDLIWAGAIIGAAFGAIGGVVGFLAGGVLSRFKNKRINSWVSIICVVISVQVSRQVRSMLQNEGYGQTYSEANMLSLNTQAAKNINSHVPHKLDSITTLVSAEGTKDALYYDYQLALPISGLPQPDALLKIIRPMLLKNACTTQATEVTMNVGDVLVYRYYDQAGAPITTVAIRKADCKNL